MKKQHEEDMEEQRLQVQKARLDATKAASDAMKQTTLGLFDMNKLPTKKVEDGKDQNKEGDESKTEAEVKLAAENINDDQM